MNIQPSRAAIASLVAIVLAAAAFAWAQGPAGPGGTLTLTPSERNWLRQHPVVRTRISPTYPPFEFYQDDRFRGLAVDYLDLVSQRLGIRFEPIAPDISWSESVAGLQQRQGVDLILMITHTLERERDIAFTKDFTSFPLVVFNRKDSDFIGGIQDLAGKKIAMEQGYIFREWLERDVPGVKIADVESSEQALNAVSTGTADAYVGNLAVGTYFIGTLGLVNLKVAAPTPYDHDALAMGVRKDWPQLAALIDKALDSITENEEHALERRWLSVRYEHGIQILDILFWVAVVAIIALAFIIQLRRLVKLRTEHLEKEIGERILTEQALKESRAQYQSLVDNLPIGVNVMDADYRIVMSNETMARWFAKEKPLFEGQHCFAEFRKNSGPCEFCPGSESMRTGDLTVVETETLRDDGSRFPVRIHTVPLGPPEGRRGFIELVEDLTAEKKALEEKAKVERQLHQAQKMESIGTLAGGIAHDFNNILTPILGYAELARLEAVNDPKMLDYIGQIADAAKRATGLVRQILTFSRMSEQQKNALHISSIVKEALKLLRSSIPTTIEIRQDIASEALVLADPTQIHQVMMNLCTNAYQAMEQTGGTLSVSMQEAAVVSEQADAWGIAPGRYVVIEVSDTGCGMAKSVQDRIFEPYFTTKEKGKGTGLGLAVVHGIVRGYGGAISVNSEPGLGTTFRIHLPVAPEESVVTAPAGDDGSLTARGYGRILFVDDEESICSLAEKGLAGSGYTVEICRNGRDALCVIEENPKAYDLLITDMTMPGLNGKELVKKVLALRPELPIILCTGHSSLVTREEAESLGTKVLFIEKPITMSEILNKIKLLMGSFYR